MTRNNREKARGVEGFIYCRAVAHRADGRIKHSIKLVLPSHLAFETATTGVKEKLLQLGRSAR
jgi:hypothetical protein